ncbi:uncharacterized protein A4U43_C03F30010 [Asparagus officinalis]|uniref:Uncharacterized protein n=1 Tax=Asparagus officinalis TaxID=4686 RepID=A0A5P1FES9_ASPOF|nr:protein CHUP1, chloroplastic-like [Asparagus officinalis]ONK76602.1 uncharacterized protein A4U43_C03F30010 [Asparagus officinalis]
MEAGLLVKGVKRNIRPLVLKLGFTLAIFVAGYFAHQLHDKLKSKSSSGDGSKESTDKSSAITAPGLKDELHILKNEEAFAKIVHGSSTIMSNDISNIATATVEEVLLMPGYDKIEENTVKSLEKEIGYLRNLVEALKERERGLEMQIIDYYELKDQEASLRELENRLKANAMESKLLNLKIESLQENNEKLQARAVGYPTLVSELESAREEIELLKERLKFDEEETEEKLLALQERITELVDRERKHCENYVEVEKKLKRLKELEEETVDLRKVNSRLEEENLKLVQQLERAPMRASSDQAEATDETRNVREENKNQKNQTEQIQTDRFSEIEELVYLRRIDACLRHEHRDHHHSPESGANEKHGSPLEFDTETCSPSQISVEDHSDTSTTSSTKKSRRSKIINKLQKLVLRKDKRVSKVEDANARRKSFDSFLSCISVENENWQEKQRASEDCLSNWTYNLDHEEADDPEKTKTKKFADVLKDSHEHLKSRRRLQRCGRVGYASFSSN